MTATEIAALSLVVAAAGALATWRAISVSRNQQANQASYELAKRLLDRMLKLEATIRTLRLGFWKEEQPLWEEISQVGTEIDAAFREGHVLWGDKFATLKRPLKDCVGDLWTAKRHSERASENYDRMTDEQIDKVWQETSPFLNASDKNDEFAKRIRKAIKAIEKRLAPHLRRSWWHR